MARAVGGMTVRGRCSSALRSYCHDGVPYYGIRNRGISAATVIYQCIWGPRCYNTVGPAVEGGPLYNQAAPSLLVDYQYNSPLITTPIRARGRAGIEQGLSAGPN
jgi:hypothetical protein